MRLLRRQNVTKVVTPKQLEDLIKDLLESPENFGKSHFATKLIFSASGTDGKVLRERIYYWLDSTHLRPGDAHDEAEAFRDVMGSEKDIKIGVIEGPKKDLNKLFDSIIKKDENGAPTE